MYCYVIVVVMNDQNDGSKGRAGLLLLAGSSSLILFGFMALLYSWGYLSTMDLSISKVIPHSNSFAWSVLTSSGDAVIALYVIVVPIYYLQNGKSVPLVYYRFLVSLVVGMFLVVTFKAGLGELRPGVSSEAGSFLDRLRHLSLYGFPSGHTVRATIIGWYLGLGRRMWVKTVVALWVVTIGLSRVIVGAHWPGDVLAGFLLGMGVAALVDYCFTSRCRG